jgi:hypothetical protein
LWDESDRLIGAPPGSRGDAGDAFCGGAVVDLVVLKKRSHEMGKAKRQEAGGTIGVAWVKDGISLAIE